MTVNPKEVSPILNYLAIQATRGSLEKDTSWFFKELGRKIGADKANRYTLEKIYFLSELFDIKPLRVYALRVGDRVYRHQYYSSAELIDFLIKYSDLILTNIHEINMAKTGEDIHFARIK